MELASLRLPAEIGQLDEYRLFVIRAADEAGLPGPMHGKLELILEELLVNVVSYAYPDGEGEVEVSCLREDDRFCLRITDWGPAFDPLHEAAAPDLDAGVEERGIGGLGIFFVREMSDEVIYQRDGEANILTICFNLPNE